MSDSSERMLNKLVYAGLTLDEMTELIKVCRILEKENLIDNLRRSFLAINVYEGWEDFGRSNKDRYYGPDGADDEATGKFLFEVYEIFGDGWEFLRELKTGRIVGFEELIAVNQKVVAEDDIPF